MSLHRISGSHGDADLTVTRPFDMYYNRLKRYLPQDLLDKYPGANLTRLVRCFVRSSESGLPSVAFYDPDFGHYTIPLSFLPTGLSLALGDKIPDMNGIFSEWFCLYASYQIQAVDESKSPLIRPETAELYPVQMNQFLRQFCAISLASGKVQADYPVCSTLYRGHHMLHCLTDSYPWKAVYGLARLPEEYALQEAQKLHIYSQEDYTAAINQILTPYVGQKVVVAIRTRTNRDVRLYGDFDRSATPGRFVIADADAELDARLIAFIASVDEIDQMIKLETEAAAQSES